MSDYESVVHGDTKEAVAYALLLGIASNAGKVYSELGTSVVKADEKWVLETYAKCLRVAAGAVYHP